MRLHSYNFSALIGFFFLVISSMDTWSAGLPLNGKSVEDVRVDFPGYPLAFRLLDKEGKVRFQVLSSGRLSATAVERDGHASTTIIVVSIEEEEWQLHTYKIFSKPVLRMFPMKSESRAVLRVWTKQNDFFDIDLDFGEKLEFQSMGMVEESDAQNP